MHLSLLLLGLAGVADAVVTAVFVWFFRAALNTPLFLRVVDKTARAGNYLRCAKLCIAAEGALAGRYCQFLLSLEIPRKTLRGYADGFRDAAPAADFDEVVAAESKRARRLFEARVHRIGAAGAVGATVALALAVAYLQAFGEWPLQGWDATDTPSKAALVLGGIAILLGQSTLRAWPRLIGHLRMVERSVLPLLKPKEEMTDDQKEAAAFSRKRTVVKPSWETSPGG